MSELMSAPATSLAMAAARRQGVRRRRGSLMRLGAAAAGKQRIRTAAWQDGFPVAQDDERRPKHRQVRRRCSGGGPEEALPVAARHRRARSVAAEKVVSLFARRGDGDGSVHGDDGTRRGVDGHELHHVRRALGRPRVDAAALEALGGKLQPLAALAQARAGGHRPGEREHRDRVRVRVRLLGARTAAVPPYVGAPVARRLVAVNRPCLASGVA